MITQQAARRRQGRAIRKRRRLGHPPPSPELVESFEAVRRALAEAWREIQRAAKAAIHFVTTLAYRLTPLIHNGRKYRR